MSTEPTCAVCHLPATVQTVQLGDTLKGLMAATGLSFQTLSARSHVDVKYLHDLATGKKARPSRDVLIRLGFGLGLELDQLDCLLAQVGHPTLVPARLASREIQPTVGDPESEVVSD